jgi:hypothetical protein
MIDETNEGTTVYRVTFNHKRAEATITSGTLVRVCGSWVHVRKADGEVVTSNGRRRWFSRPRDAWCDLLSCLVRSAAMWAAGGEFKRSELNLKRSETVFVDAWRHATDLGVLMGLVAAQNNAEKSSPPTNTGAVSVRSDVPEAGQ